MIGSVGGFKDKEIQQKGSGEHSSFKLKIDPKDLATLGQPEGSSGILDPKKIREMEFAVKSEGVKEDKIEDSNPTFLKRMGAGLMLALSCVGVLGLAACSGPGGSPTAPTTPTSIEKTIQDIGKLVGDYSGDAKKVIDALQKSGVTDIKAFESVKGYLKTGDDVVTSAQEFAKIYNAASGEFFTGKDISAKAQAIYKVINDSRSDGESLKSATDSFIKLYESAKNGGGNLDDALKDFQEIGKFAKGSNDREKITNMLLEAREKGSKVAGQTEKLFKESMEKAGFLKGDAAAEKK